MKKKLLAILLPVLILLLACSAGTAADRLEGNGYDTPEEAVLAYLDALNRGDVGGMLSTFAIETYVKRWDPELYLQHNRNYKPSFPERYVPREDAFALSLIEQARYGGLASELLANEIYDLFRNQQVSYRTTEEKQAVANQLRQAPALNPVGNVEFVRWVGPAGLTRGQIVHPAQGRSFPENVYTGADDLTEVIAQIRIDGTDAYQVMTCARYGDRWYNQEFGGRTLALAGVRMPMAYYLWIPTEEEQRDIIDQNLAADYPEEEARWEALQKSEIAGEKWSLVSLNVPDVTVYETAESAIADSDHGIHAEVHFFRNGGAVMTVTAGASMQKRLSMDDATGRICFSWSPDGIRTTYETKKGKTIPTYREFYREDIGCGDDVSEATLSEAELTFVLRDGTRAVFRRPAQRTETVSGLPLAKSAGRLEGEGFGTPEEAVLAYVEAMNRGDVRGMLFTFAMESYAEHADPDFRYEQLGIMNARYVPENGLPHLNDYLDSLTACSRYGTISKNLLLNYCLTATGTDMPVTMKEPAEIVAFEEQFRQSPLYSLAGSVEFIQWLSPVNLSDGRIVGGISPDSAIVAGADDLAETAALVRINGKDAVLSVRCVRYGNRWYNLDLTGSAALYMTSWLEDRGANSLPLIILTDEEKAELQKRLDTDYPEENARWNATRNSGIAGEKWPLILTDAAGVAVCDTAEAAETSSGTGVWAEIRWFGTGSGVITLAASPAMQEQLGMAGPVIRISFDWTPADVIQEMKGAADIQITDMHMISAASRDTFRIDAESVTAVPEESYVTLVLSDGTCAVFQRPR